ncbi:MAG: Flagellar motor rotation protein MotB [Myxococcaceae bacterium]|nr:Flagellar motor rotation protein MotB [Myxococcaceae bacterium]
MSALVLGSANRSSAQSLTHGGYDLRLFRHAVDSKGLASTNGTDILGHKSYSFGLVLDGAFRLVPYQGFKNDANKRNDQAERSHYLVNEVFTGVLHFNYGLFDKLVVGAQLPVVIVGGPNVTAPGDFNDPARGGLGYQGLGNIVLHAKYRVLRMETAPIGVATIMQVSLPTGSSKEFAGEPGVTVWPSVVVGYRPIRRLRLNAEGGYRLVTGKGATVNLGRRTAPSAAIGTATNPIVIAGGDRVTYNDQVTFGGGLAARVSKAVDLIAEGYGNYLVANSASKGGRSLATEILLGAKIFVQENSYLLLAGSCGNACMPLAGFNQPEWRGVLGFIYEPSIGDADGDGYKDDVDACPQQPEDFDDFEDAEGCPDPDNDQDGILDIDDECPLIPEDLDGDSDKDGCPEGDNADRDGDGILDNEDQCPDDPEDIDGFEDSDGCPDPDNDKDGILDKDDLCPNNPEDKDGFQDKDGCPDPDNDQDRILDKSDSCPNDPETYNGFEDKDGCPDQGSVIIEENQIVILEKIYFETDSAEIQKRSYPIIDAVAATLIGNPQITLIEIQGHADERSSDEYNVRLTRDRAAAVLEAIVQRGVDRRRMRSGGYGERCPIDPAHNDAAWEKNRRVEFKIIENEDGPTGIEVVCPAGKSLIPKK